MLLTISISIHQRNFLLSVHIAVPRSPARFSFLTVSELSSQLKLKLRSSDQDKFVISQAYIEYGIFALFRIDLMNLIDIKASLAKNFHIQPSEIDRMPMWEYELFIEKLNNQVKEENKKQQEEMDKYHIDDYRRLADPKNINRMMTQSSKMPSFSGASMIGGMRR